MKRGRPQSDGFPQWEDWSISLASIPSVRPAIRLVVAVSILSRVSNETSNCV
jgi:hypothetical protein